MTGRLMEKVSYICILDIILNSPAFLADQIIQRHAVHTLVYVECV